MNRKILTEPVRVTGTNLTWGNAWVLFEPMPHGQSGIFWKLPTSVKNEYKYIPIDWRIAKCSKKYHNVYLEHDLHRLYIYEHIAALRYDGYDGFSICGTEWPPYETTANYKEKLNAKTLITEDHIPFFRFEKPHKLSFVTEDKLYRSIEIKPTDKLHTNVEAHVKYKKLEIDHGAMEIVTNDLIETIFPVGPQGIWPDYYYFSKFLGMQYHKTVVFPKNEKDKKLLAKKFVWHTMLDRLGDISLLSHNMLLSGEIISYCSGHEMALELVKQIGQTEKIVQITAPTLTV